MTIQTETHAQRFGVLNHVHFVDLAVALVAGDAAVHVHRVIEVNVIGRLMNPLPGYGVARGIARSHRRQ